MIDGSTAASRTPPLPRSRPRRPPAADPRRAAAGGPAPRHGASATPGLGPSPANHAGDGGRRRCRRKSGRLVRLGALGNRPLPKLIISGQDCQPGPHQLVGETVVVVVRRISAHQIIDAATVACDQHHARAGGDRRGRAQEEGGIGPPLAGPYRHLGRASDLRVGGTASKPASAPASRPGSLRPSRARRRSRCRVAPDADLTPSSAIPAPGRRRTAPARSPAPSAHAAAVRTGRCVAAALPWRSCR